MTSEVFANWVNELLAGSVPEGIEGYCFNLYQDDDTQWSVELVGAAFYDEENDDWPCEEITSFGTRENPLEWEEETDSATVLSEVSQWIAQYLNEGPRAALLQEAKGVACGFVDGELVYFKKTEE